MTQPIICLTLKLKREDELFVFITRLQASLPVCFAMLIVQRLNISRSMRNLFPGYYKPTKEEFETLWKECIFSFDANILLNIYRYSPKTRERFFEILDKLSDRVWITYQAAYEYQKNRLNVISEQVKPYNELSKLLNDEKNGFLAPLEQLRETLRRYAKRHSFSAYIEEKQIIEPIERLHKKLVRILSEADEKHRNEAKYDDFHNRLADLLDEKVGPPYSQEDLDGIYKEAKDRFQKDCPPGYMDARGSDKKPEPECYGDVVVWFQLIDYAKQENKPIVLVTDDGKEDWWQESHGKKYGPRPELRQEMFSRTQVSFYLYTGDQFLEHAEKFLDLTSEPGVVEEAREVRLEEAMAQQSHKDEQQLVDQANQLFHALDSLKGPDLSALRAGNLSELVKGIDFSNLRGAELANLKNRFGVDSQMLENMKLRGAFDTISQALNLKGIDFSNLRGAELANLKNRFGVDSQMLENMELRGLQPVLAGIDPKTLQAISGAGGLAGAISGLASPISNVNAKPQRHSVQNQQPEGFNSEVPEESEPNPEVEE